jgi:Lipocalin-like domain
MKKIILISMVAASSVWFGCSKKNDVTPITLTPANATVTDLVGKWNGTKIVMTDTVNNEIHTTTQTLNPGDIDYQFNSDETGSIGGLLGQNIFTYTLSGGIIQLTLNDQVVNYTIKTISKTTLTFDAKFSGRDQALYLSK